MTYPKGFDRPKAVPTHGTLPKGYKPPDLPKGDPPRRYSSKRKSNKNSGPGGVVVAGLTFIILGLIEYSSNIGSAKFLASSNAVVILSIIFIVIGLILFIVGILAWMGSKSPSK